MVFFKNIIRPFRDFGLVFAERVLGLVERFKLFRQYDFGWHVPVFSPEAWWGLVTGPNLDAYEPRLRMLLDPRG